MLRKSIKRALIYAIIIFSLFYYVESRDISSSQEENILNSEEETTKEMAEKSTTPESSQSSEDSTIYFDLFSHSEQVDTGSSTEDNFNEVPKGKENFYDSFIAFVEVYLYIRSVSNIDETVGTVTLEIDMEIKWENPDYQNMSNLWVAPHEYIVEPKYFEKMWKPDINFDENVNLANQSLLRKPLRLTYNTSSEYVSYITRDSVKLNCEMDFTYYPADTQRCDFTIRSYNYDKRTLLEWQGVTTQNLTDQDFEVQVDSIDIKHGLPQLNKNFKGDKYEGLVVTLVARRKISYHVVQTYLPSILYILITCLCFLVPSHMVEVRIGINMTTLLTLTAMFSSVRESTPSVSYVKAIDIWMAFCIFFVFLTLLEFTTLLWFRYQRKAAEKKRLENQKMLQALEGVIGGKCLGGPVSTIQRNFSVEAVHYKNHEKFSEAVEKYGLFVFSFGFVLFIIIYWTWLICQSGYYNWKIIELFLEKEEVEDNET